MSNAADSDDCLQESFELVECDGETARNYMAMAEMEEGMKDQADVDATDDTPKNVMQFTANNVNKNQNDGAFNSYSMNDMQNHIGSFSQNFMETEIKSVEKKGDVIEKHPLYLDQEIDKKVIKIMKDNPKVNSSGVTRWGQGGQSAPQGSSFGEIFL